jgi:hypothetical protein
MLIAASEVSVPGMPSTRKQIAGQMLNQKERILLIAIVNEENSEGK